MLSVLHKKQQAYKTITQENKLFKYLFFFLFEKHFKNKLQFDTKKKKNLNFKIKFPHLHSGF